MLLGRKSVNKLNKLTFGFCFSHPPPPFLPHVQYLFILKKVSFKIYVSNVLKLKKKPSEVMHGTVFGVLRDIGGPQKQFP